MTTYEANLQSAQHLCAQAQADAQGDPLLQRAIGNTQATVNDLLNRVTARAQAIRNSPAYLAQQIANAQRRHDRERIWREAFELERQRRSNAFAWRWHYEWRSPRVEVVHVVQPPMHLPRPIVATHPGFGHHQAPIHAPRPPYHHIPTPRPEIPYAAPPAPMAPMPPPLQRLDHMRDTFIRESIARQGPQPPFHAPPARVNPMHPAHAFGRGNRHFRTL